MVVTSLQETSACTCSRALSCWCSAEQKTSQPLAGSDNCKFPTHWWFMLSQREKGINDRYTQRLSRPQNSCWSLGNPLSPSCLVTRIVQLCKRLFDALNWGNADDLCLGEWHWCCGKLKRAILTLALSVCVWLKAVRHWSLYPNITHTSAIDINNAYMTLCRKQVWNVLGPFSSQYIKKQRAVLNITLQWQGKALGQSVSEWMFWFIYLLNKIFY